jgi:hypothetical protein
MTTTESKNEIKRIMKWKEQESPTVYSNMIGIGMTPFDINLIFGEVVESDGNTVTGVPRVKILLTPEQALNLQKLLSVTVDAYIKSNGPLRTAGAVDTVELAAQVEASMPKVH